MKIADEFYSNIFHPDYFCFVNNLISNEIQKLTPNALHITFFDSFYDNDYLKFEDIFLNFKGNVNHLNEIGNKIIYTEIIKKIK